MNNIRQHSFLQLLFAMLPFGEPFIEQLVIDAQGAQTGKQRSRAPANAGARLRIAETIERGFPKKQQQKPLFHFTAGKGFRTPGYEGRVPGTPVPNSLKIALLFNVDIQYNVGYRQKIHT